MVYSTSGPESRGLAPRLQQPVLVQPHMRDIEMCEDESALDRANTRRGPRVFLHPLAAPPFRAFKSHAATYLGTTGLLSMSPG